MRVEREGESKFSSYALRMVFNTLSHPFEYAKVLIQIGYEPLPPRPAKTLLGRPALKLPNIFQYVKHIKSVDGFSGCYRGVGPKVCGNIISTIAATRVIDYLHPRGEEAEEEDDEETEEARRRRFFKCLKTDIITHTTAIIVSHPFHVITVRIMSQFVGRETKYGGFFSSTAEIYRQNGIMGFFSGLIPRLIGDLCAVVLASALTYLFNKYVVEDKELQNYTTAVLCMLSSSIMYPFQVVSHCMAVTNSGLAAGSPPFMPHYASWVDCWSDLSQRSQLKRGASLLIRYYTGPPQFMAPKPGQAIVNKFGKY